MVRFTDAELDLGDSNDSNESGDSNDFSSK